MKVKAVKTITTCITAGKEYEVVKDGLTGLLIVGDDDCLIGLSKDNFEIKETVLTPVQWLVDQLTKIGSVMPEVNLHKKIIEIALQKEVDNLNEEFEKGKGYGESCVYEG